MPSYALSTRIQTIKPSPTIAVADKARELRASGKDILALGTGEPDFDTPAFIKEKAIAAINAGQTKYTPVDGTVELKDAIIEKLARDNQLHYERSQILVSCGAKHSLYNAVQALMNPADEAIIPAPFWVSYPDMVRLADGVPVVIESTREQAYKITPEQLKQAITPKTRLLFINSPSNPSGAVYKADELSALAGVLKQHPHVVIATDDIYEHIVWKAGSFVNILNVCPELRDRTIVINGVSKAYAMTGWRIGYAAGPEAIIKAMKKGQSQATSGPCSISQAAATAALTGPQDCLAEMCDAFRERHDYIVHALNQIDGITCQPNGGTFYAFADVSGAIERLPDVNNDIEYSEWLLEKAGIAIVPGSAFGTENHIRLSYATNMETLKKAIERLNKV